MMRSMYSGVSGLKNHQIMMDTIGNNIANVNTTGYKSSSVSFQDMLSQTLSGATAPNGARGGTNAIQVGLGMNLATIDVIQTQGNLQNTGKSTDMALQGDGFFVLNDGSQQYYTRSGNFNLEKDGRLDNGANGLIVQGWMADNKGVLNTNAPSGGIQLPVGQTIAPIPTSTIQYANNLNAFTNAKLTYGTSMMLTDDNGKTVSVSVNLTPVPDAFNTYDYAIVPATGDITAGGTGTGRIILDQYGVVTSVTGGVAGKIAITPSQGDPIEVELPTVGSRDGGFFTINPTGPPQAIALAPGLFPAGSPFNTNVMDQAGNTVGLQYTYANIVGTNTYKWTVTAPAGGTVLSGATGTFDWTAATGITNSTDVDTIVQSNAGNDIHINSPINGAGTPSFAVVERAPAQPAVGAVGVGVFGPITYNDSAGTPVTVTYTVTHPAGPTSYSWNATVGGGGTLVSGGTGTFTWNAGSVSNSTTTPMVIKSSNGLEITINPPINGAAANMVFTQVPGLPVTATFTAPPDVKGTTTVYDSLGVPHTITTDVHRIDTNKWAWTATEGAGLPITNGSGILTFDNQTGYATNSPGGPMTFIPIGADPVSIKPDFSKVSQGYDSAVNNVSNWPTSTFNGPTQDGYPMGILTGFNIDSAGRIVGVFSNGMNQNLAQVAIANFTNPGGLTRSGDTMFQQSSNSGAAQIGQAGVGSNGTVASGELEMSNVDLSQEFTDMIVTERGFQANSKIISTSDEMLQTLVDLKR